MEARQTVVNDRALIVEIFEPIQIVGEQASQQGNILPIEKSVIDAITEGDDDPRFATFVVESGWSRSKRYWAPSVFTSVHEQISNPSGEPFVGYLGHINPEEDPYAFPEIQFQWLKSSVQEMGNKARIFLKAYVLPDTKARYYLKRGLAKSVSWRGEAVEVPMKGGRGVKDFFLESIDLARPRKAGMSASIVGGLTTEMHEGEGGSVNTAEISALTENELRAHNPTLVQAIEEGATKPLAEQVSKLEETTKDKEKEQVDLLSEIRRLFGIAEDAPVLDVLKKAAEELSNAGRAVRDSLLSDVLKGKFKDDRTRTLVQRLVAAEMSDRNVELSGDNEADKKIVTEMVNNFINEDDDLKSMVSEMEGDPADPPGTGKTDDSGKREIKEGYESSNIRVKAAQ
jgi:hypothetical protein